MITIVGKSNAALTMICDAISSQGSNGVSRELIIFNNLNIPKLFSYSNFKFSETDKLTQNGAFFLGAVMPETKKTLVKLFPRYYSALFNESADLSEALKHGDSLIVDSLASIAGGVLIGNYVTVYANSSIAHHSTLGDYVTICPNVAVCGEVKIGEGTFIGAGSVIKNGISIGKNCVIGCGSVVLNDVADGKTVYGNPAQIKTTNNLKREPSKDINGNHLPFDESKAYLVKLLSGVHIRRDGWKGREFIVDEHEDGEYFRWKEKLFVIFKRSDVEIIEKI